MVRLHLDVESYSEADLKTEGVYRYAADPSTELLCLSYCFDDGPVFLWVPCDKVGPKLAALIAQHIPTNVLIQKAVPADLRAHIASGGEIRAFNAQFERVVLNGTAGKKVKFPEITIAQSRCVAAKARCHGLPGNLGDAAEAVGAPPKNEFGKTAMLSLCRPRSGAVKRYDMEEDADKYAALYKYNVEDTEAERGVDDLIPDLTVNEQAIWEMDQRVNSFGIRIDRQAIADVQFLVDEYKGELADLCAALTGHRPSQREKIAGWVRVNGYPSPTDLQSETVQQAVKDPACPEPVRRVLQVYSSYGAKAVSKFESMVRMAGKDDRLRGMFLHYGAGPGRWASLGVQLQNLARPTIEDPELAIEIFKARDLDWVKFLYPENPIKVFASTVRGMLIPSPGKRILAMDFAGIESRLTAWVFGENWKLAAFRAMDAGVGPDTYKLSYANSFQIAVEEITSKQRQIGKVCVAEGTPVLCESGWKPIEFVTAADKVWDGEQWVNHKGLLNNGLQTTVSLYGSWLTPDHLVWSGREWKRTDWLLENKDQCLTRALAFAAVNLPSRGICEAYLKTQSLRSSSCAPVAAQSSRWLNAISGYLRLPGALFVETRKRIKRASRFGNSQTQCPNTTTDGGSAPGLQQPLRAATYPHLASFTHTAGEAYSCVQNGVRISEFFYATLERWRDGITRICRWIGSTTTEGTNQAIFVLSPEKRTTRIDGHSENTTRKLRVYDLLSAGSKNRFTILTNEGPLLVHNCELSMGFEGGVGAFATMVQTYGVNLTELADSTYPILPHDVLTDAHGTWEWAVKNKRTLDLPQKVYVVCDALKRLWRISHPAHVAGWANMKAAATAAVNNPGVAFEIPGGKIKFKVKDRWLYMRLPSGRCIAYFKPRIDDEGVLRYWGINTKSRKWGWQGTYGGKLTQNFSEGIARDLLAPAMQRWEKKKWDVIGSVHDEAIAEVPPDTDFEEAKRIFLDQPDWSAGLPLNAGGFIATRYRK